VQALSLTKARANRLMVETAQGAHVIELDADNAKLLMELKQTRLALAEADATQNPLSLDRRKLEGECADLRVVVETLG
jgi:hypothetical protein